MTKLGLFCENILEAGWLATIAAVPLFFNIYSSRVFEPDKIIILRCIVLVMALSFAIRGFERGWKRAQAGDVAKDKQPGVVLSVHKRGLSPNLLLVSTLFFALAYTLATLFSIVPSISLWGSYQRLQGTYTVFTYLLFFLMVIQTLRRREQLDRLINVILLTSVPISLYGLVQHLSKDPLPWSGDVVFRVTSSMGNAIFLGAYLIMVVPLTLARLLDALARLRQLPKPPIGHFYAGSSALLGRLAILILQNVVLAIPVIYSVNAPNVWWGALGAIGIFLALSLSFRIERASYLVVLGEMVGYGLLLCLQLVTLFLTQSRGPLLGLLAGLLFFLLALAQRRKQRRLLWSTVAVSSLLVGLLIVFNLSGTPLEPFKKVPYIGRLGELTQVERGTGKVRILIWQGALQLITTKPNVGFRTDPLGVLRPLVGYGPEAMLVAFSKVYPPNLAHYEARNASPDRSHNDLLDHLVMEGVLGLVSFLLLVSVGFYYGWKLLWQTNGFCGQALILGLLSALVAHFIELQFGIAIVATWTYFWLYLALLGCLGARVIERSSAEAGVVSTRPGDTTDKGIKKLSKSKAGAVRGTISVGRHAPKERLAVGGMVLPGATLTWSYLSISVMAMWILSRLPPIENVQLALVGAFVWFLLGMVLVAISLPKVSWSNIWQRRNWWAYAIVTPLIGMAVFLNLNVIAADVYYKRADTADKVRNWEVSLNAYQHAIALAPNQDLYYLFLGRAYLEIARSSSKVKASPPLAFTLQDALSLSVKRLTELSREDLLNLSLVTLEEARRLNPLNTDHYANLARLYRAWGELADRNKLDLAHRYYQQATTLSPHSAHLYDEWAQIYLLQGNRQEALRKVEASLQLDPLYYLSYVIRGDVFLSEGEFDQALADHRKATDLNPSALADSQFQQRVELYLKGGRDESLANILGRAVSQNPNLTVVHNLFGYVLSRQGKLREAAQQFEASVAIEPRDWLAYRNLALVYRDMGAMDQAIAAAQAAKRYAPTTEASGLQAFIDDLQKRRGP
ncbi:MAG: O-antigen ligase family protein [Chloroflexi bacterium]|nr:O-antigen ligase family protein [Chloroflexota bacterium]MCL5074033.1 O-antigen ligase family protein [Chloroflexota bacterium]